MIERTYTAARKAQGFKSQADLTAFLAYHDHTAQCAECQLPGPGILLGDSYAPTMNRCDKANALYATWLHVHDVLGGEG